ncbi:MAG TPA: hypothetical protein VIY48_10785 [Candidatus Paceibacterota bacterium]
MNAEGQEDRGYWNDKYDEDPSCEDHGEDEMYYSHTDGEYYCLACQREDEIVRTYTYG